MTHTVDTSSLQLADQQMLQPQLLQQVHTGPSDIGHIETVNVQVGLLVSRLGVEQDVAPW